MSTTVAARPRTLPRLGRAPAIVAIAAPVVFVAFHANITWLTLELARSDEAAEHIPLDPVLQTLVGGIGSNLIEFGAFALAGVVLARLGYRVLWAAPVLIGVFGYAIGAGHMPQSIGGDWFLEGAPGWLTHPWAASAIDVALCLAVALPFLTSPRRARRRHSAIDLLALLSVGAMVAITLRTAMVVDNSMPAPPIVAAVCAFSLLATTSRPWPWTVTLCALGLGGTLDSILWMLLPPFPGAGPAPSIASQLGSALLWATPLVVCALVVSLWDRLGTLLRTADARPIWLAVGVNVLNVADAALTQFAVRAGAAAELNPVVRAIGLPAKVVLVGLLSWFLYRRRPAALLIPAAILLVVLAYHVSGLVIDG